MNKQIEKTQAEQVSQQPEVRPCPQDCSKCGPWQQMFCCTKMMFDLSRSLQTARQEVEQLRLEVTELKNKMPNQATEFSNPTLEDTAQ